MKKQKPLILKRVESIHEQRENIEHGSSIKKVDGLKYYHLTKKQKK